MGTPWLIVLGTNVLSELAKPAAAPIVVAWANAQRISELYTTAINQSEMLFGLAIMPSVSAFTRATRGPVQWA